MSVEHPELRNSFGPGPNFFDDFALSGTASAPYCKKINAEAAGLRSKLSELQKAKAAPEALEAEAALEASRAGERAARTMPEDHLAPVHASTSWKVTAPLRGIKKWRFSGGELRRPIEMACARHPCVDDSEARLAPTPCGAARRYRASRVRQGSASPCKWGTINLEALSRGAKPAAGRRSQRSELASRNFHLRVEAKSN